MSRQPHSVTSGTGTIRYIYIYKTSDNQSMKQVVINNGRTETIRNVSERQSNFKRSNNQDLFK